MNAKTQFAKELRKDQTKAEEIVWKEIRNRKFLGLRFKRQFIIEGFIVDFYCDEFALAIEIDGRIHEKQKEYDAWRQKIIESNSVSFIRIKNEEVFQDIGILFDKIKDFVKNNIPRERSMLVNRYNRSRGDF
jgi:very-short-patch-repair endonuclease